MKGIGIMKLEIENISSCSFLGRDLINELYLTAHRLNIDYIQVNAAKYNKYADCSLFEGKDCIDWHYIINV